MEPGSFLENGMLTFNSAAEAANHPLGAKLFLLEGVANIFLLPQFLTITKRASHDWDELLVEVIRLLEAHYSG